MRWLLQWCVVVLLCAMLSGSSAAQRPVAGACEAIVWSAPDTLRTPSGLAVFVEHPQVIATSAGSVLIASWGAEVDSGPRARTAGYTVANDGVVRSIPLPVEFPS